MSEHTPSSTKKPKVAAPTFEQGARQMKEALKDHRPEAFFANPEDPLRHAFAAKAIIHSGPSGMPLMGDEARATLNTVIDKPSTGKTLAYFHVPFCETRCLYCMFYQNPLAESASKRYADALVRELELWADKPIQKDSKFNALYFGGGTPTALEANDMRRVLAAIHKYLPLTNDCEITMEARFHNFGDDKVEAALEGGVNRFSLGVQTFNSEIRQSMQRVDDLETMVRRIEYFASFNQAAIVTDLIYGFPGQTPEVWEEDLKMAASLPLDGIDCYQLNVFEKSPLATRIASGKLPQSATSDQKAEMFARSVEFFTNQNWRRLSNNHWAQGNRERNIYNHYGKSACDCLAFGSAAGGRLHQLSFMTDRNLEEYYRLIDAGQKPAQFLLAPKANWELLRTVSAEMESGAMNLHRMSEKFGINLVKMAEPIINQWLEAGLLEERGQWLVQTVAGQYWHVTMAQLLVNWLEPMLPGYQDKTDELAFTHGQPMRKHATRPAPKKEESSTPSLLKETQPMDTKTTETIDAAALMASLSEEVLAHPHVKMMMNMMGIEKTEDLVNHPDALKMIVDMAAAHGANPAAKA